MILHTGCILIFYSTVFSFLLILIHTVTAKYSHNDSSTTNKHVVQM